MIDTLNALMITRPILVAAQSNANSPIHHYVQELPNFVHVEALQILYAQLEVFTNFYDSAHNFNVSEIKHCICALDVLFALETFFLRLRR